MQKYRRNQPPPLPCINSRVHLHGERKCVTCLQYSLGVASFLFLVLGKRQAGTAPLEHPRRAMSVCIVQYFHGALTSTTIPILKPQTIGFSAYVTKRSLTFAPHMVILSFVRNSSAKVAMLITTSRLVSSPLLEAPLPELVDLAVPDSFLRGGVRESVNVSNAN